ncbi:TIGR02281 family clan AA aspartic protease [Pseudorhodoplanes sp.]|uniref:retropepsin-like aspartic protease family protein n=1 Tax=Pseudorhodoplanes sp. TaxID=1934341 RepID=UPI00391A2479
MRSLLVVAGMVAGIAALIASWLERGTTPPAQPEPKAAIAAVQPALSSGRSVTIPRDSRGHFQVEGRIDGRRIGFMVDTGASVIALTEREAARLGIRPMRNDYTAQVRTANGTVKAAPVMLGSVDIGGLVVRDVQALVVPGDALGENLLGLSYLTRLKRFEYANNKLVLEN